MPCEEFRNLSNKTSRSKIPRSSLRPLSRDNNKNISCRDNQIRRNPASGTGGYATLSRSLPKTPNSQVHSEHNTLLDYCRIWALDTWWRMCIFHETTNIPPLPAKHTYERFRWQNLGEIAATRYFYPHLYTNKRRRAAKKISKQRFCEQEICYTTSTTHRDPAPGLGRNTPHFEMLS